MLVGYRASARLPHHRGLLPRYVEHQPTTGLLHGAGTGGLSRSRRDRDVSRHVARLFLPADGALLVRTVQL